MLKALNISKNKICSIKYLSKLVNLEYLNLSYNTVISIEVCKSFKLLKDLRTHHNKIQDLSSINSHPNCQLCWTTPQNEPTDQDFIDAGIKQSDRDKFQFNTNNV